MPTKPPFFHQSKRAFQRPSWGARRITTGISTPIPTQKIKAQTKGAGFVEGLVGTYADASGKGIGFWHDGLWEAWAFNPACDRIPRHKKTKEIDVQWAELLAVYMAVWTRSQVDETPRQIPLLLDNLSVVRRLEQVQKADEDRGCTWLTRRAYQDIMEGIGKLCRQKNTSIDPRWIGTKANLADGPSRGRLPPECTRYLASRNEVDRVPGHLLDVLVSTPRQDGVRSSYFTPNRNHARSDERKARVPA